MPGAARFRAGVCHRHSPPIGLRSRFSNLYFQLKFRRGLFLWSAPEFVEHFDNPPPDEAAFDVAGGAAADLGKGVVVSGRCAKYFGVPAHRVSHLSLFGSRRPHRTRHDRHGRRPPERRGPLAPCLLLMVLSSRARWVG